MTERKSYKIVCIYHSHHNINNKQHTRETVRFLLTMSSNIAAPDLGLGNEINEGFVVVVVVKMTNLADTGLTSMKWHSHCFRVRIYDVQRIHLELCAFSKHALSVLQ